MIFQNLVNQIKTEARLKEDSTFDDLVIALINEMFIEAVQSQRPFELRREVFLLVAAVTGVVSLPDDFFLHHQLFFNDIDTGQEWQLIDQDEASQPAPRGFYGHPTSYEVEFEEALIKPTGAIISGDQIRLIYYVAPPILSSVNILQENPIPRLEPFLLRACLRRARMFHTDDMQVVQVLSGDVASAASAYTKDTPVKEVK